MSLRLLLKCSIFPHRLALSRVRLGKPQFWRAMSSESADSVPKVPSTEESPENYGTGGYYPAMLEEVLNERYRIVRKLGWGLYSTVWLAHDSQSLRYVALKIMQAAVTNTEHLTELDFLNRAATQDLAHPGYDHLVHLRDHFRLSSPNGDHICIVTDVLGESIHSLAYRFGLPLDIVKSVVRQVLLALDYLHEECRIIHTDIKPSNILVTLDNPDCSIEEVLHSDPSKYFQFYRVSEHSKLSKFAIARSQPIRLPDSALETQLYGLKVKLTDLGVSCWRDKVTEHITNIIQTPAFRAPEVLLGAGWDTACDIWSVGVLTMELMLREPMFDSDIDPGTHLALLFQLLGQFPPAALKARGIYTPRFFKQDGSFFVDGIEAPQPRLLERIVKGASPRDDDPLKEENDLLMSFLDSVFTYMPEDRPTARQLLAHKWLSSKVPAGVIAEMDQ